MSNTIRYLDIHQIDLSKVLIKDDTVLYQYSDNIIKKLYIITPFLQINSIKSVNKINVDIPDISYYENLMNKIQELSQNTINSLIFNENKETSQQSVSFYFNKQKTEIIKHNISPKYPKIEIIKENITNTIKQINSCKKYKMESMFIFSPIIYMNNILLVSYKIEIKYKNQYIKSYLHSNEINVNYIDKLKKTIIEL